ncbi:hypothetical protein D3C71_1186720 [compost metagenome]
MDYLNFGRFRLQLVGSLELELQLLGAISKVSDFSVQAREMINSKYGVRTDATSSRHSGEVHKFFRAITI